jgi:hypothetical protein
MSAIADRAQVTSQTATLGSHVCLEIRAFFRHYFLRRLTVERMFAVHAEQCS